MNYKDEVPANGVFGNYDPPQIRLAQKWCWLQWNAATGGIPDSLLSCRPVQSNLAI